MLKLVAKRWLPLSLRGGKTMIQMHQLSLESISKG